MTKIPLRERIEDRIAYHDEQESAADAMGFDIAVRHHQRLREELQSILNADAARTPLLGSEGAK